MKDIIIHTGKQIMPILLSGIAAAGIAFFQSVATQGSVCSDPGTVAADGAGFAVALKALHTIIKFT